MLKPVLQQLTYQAWNMLDSAGTDAPYIVQLSILIGVFLLGFFGIGRKEAFKRVKMLLVWAIIILALVLGFSYWEDVKNSKFYASLFPGAPVLGENGEMVFIKADNGHFFINAVVEGRKIRFMVDTGASGIVLGQEDARELGYDLSTLRYDRVFATANGTTRGASIELGSLSIGPLEMRNLPASVNEGALDDSLLGMTFLNRLKSYRVKGNRLILVP